MRQSDGQSELKKKDKAFTPISIAGNAKTRDVHKNDHVWGSKIADIADLRHPNRTYDYARTVKLTHKLHALRTGHYARVKPRYSLEDFTKPLSEVLNPMEKADRDVWSDKNHRDAIFEDGLTPKFLVIKHTGMK